MNIYYVYIKELIGHRYHHKHYRLPELVNRRVRGDVYLLILYISALIINPSI